MAKNTTQYLTQAGRVVTVVVAIGATNTAIANPGLEGSKVLAMRIVAGTASTFNFYVFDGSSNEAVVLNNAATTDLDILDLANFPQKAGGSRYFNLESGSSLRVDNNSGIATLTITTYLEDY